MTTQPHKEQRRLKGRRLINTCGPEGEPGFRSVGNTELAAGQVTARLASFESFTAASYDSALVMFEGKNLFLSLFRASVNCI